MGRRNLGALNTAAYASRGRSAPAGTRLCSSAVLAPVNRLRDSGFVACLPRVETLG